ncbi:membrane lipoprotein lipid attachment site-containing protein [Citrobacter freundii]
MKRLIITLSLAFTLAGCSAGPKLTDFPPPPSQQQIASASYGEPPADYKEKISQYVSSRLLDPYSAKIEIGKPYKAYSQDNVVGGGLVRFGWAVPVMTNAKNAYGGYTGYKPSRFIFDHGTMYDVTLIYGLGHLVEVK